MEYSFEFVKARIYINSRKKSLAEIKEETGCDVILNGGLYDMTTFKPVCHLKADGKVYAEDQYAYWGYAWNSADNKLQMANNYTNFDNYICCVALVRGGKAEGLYGVKDTAKRGRTAIGTLPDGKTVIYCSKDGTADAMTPTALRKYFLGKGVKDAVMLDSGGSSQCITPYGSITSTRKVHNVLCFWLNKNGEDDATVNGAKVKVYSRKKDGLKKVSAHFRVNEFACNDGSDAIFIAEELVDIVEKIRSHFGKATVINSGFRTATYNKKVGGTTYSQHIYGTAADIVVKGVSPAKVADYAETLLVNKGGIGRYDTFTHIDCRKTKSRWHG